MSGSEFGNLAPIPQELQIRFFVTDPQPCPYLPNRLERKIFTTLEEIKSEQFTQYLTESGFRRSQNVFYRPVCDMCSKCVSVRIPVQEFSFKKHWRRIVHKNINVQRSVNPPEASDERFNLMTVYLEDRHKSGAMYGMDAESFMSMIEEGSQNTMLVDYRLSADGPMGNRNELMGCCLIDELMDGTSLVYSFFNPSLNANSFGSYIILDQISRLKEMGLSHLYLGYWVEGSQTMAYKTRFRPIEVLGKDGWQIFTESPK
jgi:arginine-tRNA-protein transferase